MLDPVAVAADTDRVSAGTHPGDLGDGVKPPATTASELDTARSTRLTVPWTTNVTPPTRADGTEGRSTPCVGVSVHGGQAVGGFRQVDVGVGRPEVAGMSDLADTVTRRFRMASACSGMCVSERMTILTSARGTPTGVETRSEPVLQFAQIL